MKICIASLAATFHIILVSSDIVSDILYILFSDFYNETLKEAAIAFVLVLPSMVYMAVAFLIVIYDNKKKLLRFSFLLYWLIVGPLIAPFFPLLFGFRKAIKKDNRVFFKISIIEFLFESLPQVIIQGYNNSMTNNWSVLSRVSLSFSIINLFRGGYVFTRMFDNDKEFQDKPDIDIKFKNIFRVIICLQILPMLTCWAGNIMYLFLEYENELLRYLCFLFIFLGYLGNLIGRHKGNEKLGPYNLLRIFYVSHTNECMKTIFSKDMKIKHQWVNEIIFIIFHLVPLIAIQHINNTMIGESSVIYITPLISNLVCLLISFFRILHHFIRALK